MQKGIKKLCCLVLSLTTLFSAACVSMSPSGLTPPSSYGGNHYWGNNNGGNNGGFGQSSDAEDSSDSSIEDSTGDIELPDNSEDTEFNPETPLNPVLPEVPEPDEPDQNKTVSKTETDSLGHKIVTYTDGTWEDLGRVEPLNYSTPDPLDQYGYTYLGKQTNGAGMQDFYRALHTVSTQFHESSNTLETVTSGAGKTCRLADFKLSDYGITQVQASAVWRVFANENPAFFWIDNQLSTSSTKLTMLVDDAYATPSARSNAQSKIAEMALDCDQYINGKTSEAVRAATIQDYLAGRIEYAYKTNGAPETELWAHSLVGAANQRKGVCETYAKTYDYLCTLFGLNCLLVTGQGMTDGSAVGHAWNVIELDGEWYDVDVTWNDFEDTNISRVWFGKETTEFAESHIARTPKDGWDLNFQYDLPARCNKSLNLVSYEEYNSGNYTLVGSLQAAFEQMTKTNTEYSVYLYPHTPASEKMGLTVDDHGGAEEVTFPQVATVSMVGKYTQLQGSYYALSDFTLKGEAKLSCNLAVRDLALCGEELDISNHILAPMGTMAEIDLRITPTEESAVWVQTTQGTIFKQSVKTTILAVDQDSEVRLCNGGSMQSAGIGTGATLCCYGSENVTIDWLEFGDENSRFYVTKATNRTQISIGTLTSNAENQSATIAVDFSSASEYPSITITSFATTNTKLKYQLYGTVEPYALGTLFTLGNSQLFSNVQIYKNVGGSLRAESMSKYSINSYGNVTYVG